MKEAERVVVGLEVEDEIYQVSLTDSEQGMVKALLRAIFEGEVNVLPDPMPVKFQDKISKAERKAETT